MTLRVGKGRAKGTKVQVLLTPGCWWLLCGEVAFAEDFSLYKKVEGTTSPLCV